MGSTQAGDEKVVPAHQSASSDGTCARSDTRSKHRQHANGAHTKSKAALRTSSAHGDHACRAGKQQHEQHQATGSTNAKRVQIPRAPQYAAEHVTRNRQYYNTQADLYSLIGLETLRDNEKKHARVSIYSPFFTHDDVCHALIENNKHGIEQRVYVQPSVTAKNAKTGRAYIHELYNHGVPVFVVPHLHTKAARIRYTNSENQQQQISIMGSANFTIPGFSKNTDSLMVLSDDLRSAYNQAIDRTRDDAIAYDPEKRPSQYTSCASLSDTKYLRRKTPDKMLLDSQVDDVLGQIGKSIDRTKHGDTIYVSTFSIDHNVCSRALARAAERGVDITVYIRRGARVPSILTQYNNCHVYDMPGQAYHDKTVYIARKGTSRTDTIYYITGNITHEGGHERNVMLATKEPHSLRSIANALFTKVREKLSRNSQAPRNRPQTRAQSSHLT